METKNIEIVIDGKHSYGVNLQTKLENHIIIAKMHTALMAAIPVELPVILQGELLPCPFCGSKAKVAITSQVKCSNINCVMSSHVMHDTLWNKRVNSRFSI